MELEAAQEELSKLRLQFNSSSQTNVTIEQYSTQISEWESKFAAL